MYLENPKCFVIWNNIEVLHHASAQPKEILLEILARGLASLCQPWTPARVYCLY
jgi:hypothetical protein